MTEEKQKKQGQEEYSDDVVDLVVARLGTIPSHVSISIGSEEHLSLKEVIKNVKEKNEIGKKFIEMQLNSIRSLQNLSTE